MKKKRNSYKAVAILSAIPVVTGLAAGAVMGNLVDAQPSPIDVDSSYSSPNYQVAKDGTIIRNANSAKLVRYDYVAVKRVSLNHIFSTIKVGGSVQLKATVSPSNADNKKVYWSSSNSSVATVDSNGKVKGKKAGKATITAKTSNGKKATATIYVKASNKTTKLSFKKDSVEIKVDDKKKLEYSKSPSAAKTPNCSSDNSRIAKVKSCKSDYVKIEGKSVGTTKIRIKANDGSGKSDSIKVTVKAKKIAVKHISLNHIFSTIKVGESVKLKATISPSNATNKKVYWSSSNSSVASVDSNGKVKGKKAGKVIITAKTSNGKKATATITVEAKKVAVKLTKIEMNVSTMVLTVGDKATLTIVTYPSDAIKSYKTSAIKWYSSSTKIATVKDGVVTAKSNGKATITATLDGKVAKAEIFVNKKQDTSRQKDTKEDAEKQGSFKDAKISIPKSSYTYTGSEIKPKVTVIWANGKKASSGDYVVRYSNNKNVGVATIKVSSTGLLRTGSRTISFNIYPARIDINTLNFKVAESVTYTGQAIYPKVQVYSKKYKKMVALDNSEYNLKTSYSNNTNAGTATVSITTKTSATSNKEYAFKKGVNYYYAGTVKKTFKIKSASIATAFGYKNGEKTGSSTYYTGKKQKLIGDIWVIKSSNNKKTNCGPWGKKNTPLAWTCLDKDFTVSYKDNLNAGTAIATITGKGNYSGTLKLKYTIKPLDRIAKISYEGGTFKNDGKSVKPKVTKIYGEAWNVTPVELDSSNYTVSYEARKSDRGNHDGSFDYYYYIVITGKKNLTGKFEVYIGKQIGKSSKWDKKDYSKITIKGAKDSRTARTYSK